MWDPVSAAYLRAHGHTPPPQLDSWVRGLNVREAIQFLNKIYGLDVPVQQGVQEVCDMRATACRLYFWSKK